MRCLPIRLAPFGRGVGSGALFARHQHVDLVTGESRSSFADRAPGTQHRASGLSVVSYLEVVIKARKGLLTVADPVNWWSRATSLMGGEILSIRAAHISALAGLPDP